MRAVEEQEERFEVGPDWAIPQLERLVPDGGRLDQDVRHSENTYFDTPGAGLRLFGVTLQRRVGGSETGWQLKVPNGTARTELQSSVRTRVLPPALGKAVAGLRAGERLDAVVTVNTARTAYRVLNSDGEPVLEIADDHLDSGPPDGESRLHSWREVEVELGPAGTKKDLKRARKLLRAAGATLSTGRPKLDRALGPTPSNGEELAVKAGTVGELVSGYLAAQCDVLASNDIGLRTGAAAVHQTRVAARRLRSTLRTFHDVFDAAPVEKLNNELAWYADLLGQVRDREVLNARLTTLIADLPPEHVRATLRCAPGATNTSCSCCGHGRPHRRSPTRPQARTRPRSSTWKRPNGRQTNGYGKLTTTSSGCTGRARPRSGCATPPSSPSRPMAG
jgi:inorganic triphosphatase YgiF